jgi:ankyrin repeat protein
MASEADQDFKTDYELLSDKLTDLLSAAKYRQLEWANIGGMRVLVDDTGPVSLKVPGQDAVAFVMVLDAQQQASNATCTAETFMASQQFWNSANTDNDASLNFWYDSYPNLNVNYIPSSEDDDGNDTPLCCAARNNDTAMVQEIVDWNGSPLPSCRYGFTALCYAAQNGNANMTQILINDGSVVNVDCKGKNGTSGTPLCQASEVNSTSTAEVLLAANATVNSVCDQNSPLCWAAFYNNTVLSIDYIESGADVNANCPYFSTDVEITGSSICFAVVYDNIDIASALLEAGANPNTVCNDYRTIKTRTFTPLCYAEEYHESSMITLLESYNATITPEPYLAEPYNTTSCMGY